MIITELRVDATVTCVLVSLSSVFDPFELYRLWEVLSKSNHTYGSISMCGYFVWQPQRFISPISSYVWLNAYHTQSKVCVVNNRDVAVAACLICLFVVTIVCPVSTKLLYTSPVGGLIDWHCYLVLLLGWHPCKALSAQEIC